jgi:hypothetical protein
LPDALLDKFQAWCAKAPDFDALANGKPTKRQQDETPSEYEYALAVECCKAHPDFNVVEFGQLVRAYLPATEKEFSPRRLARSWVHAHERNTSVHGIYNRPEGWTEPGGKLIKSTAAFLADFVPPSYLVDGLISRQYLYSCTALTGAGKTAIALLLAYCVAEGQKFGDREVETARVLYFAGENSTDVKMRWIAMAENLGFDPDTIEVHFIDGVVQLSKVADRIREEIDALGGAELIVVDTCAAYFEGDNENDNVQMLALAKRLREFTTLACRPCVLVLCHPVKNATNDNLLPRGGGSFLNEMDGNLTIAANDKVSTLHWQGKFRGPDFEPMSFEMVTGITAKRLVDHKGRQLHTVVARALNAATQAALEDTARRDEDRVLIVMRDHPGISIAGICDRIGWHTAKGDARKSKVQTVLKRLGKLVRKERNIYVLTEAGTKAAAKLS